jgi:hypothetical protein
LPVGFASVVDEQDETFAVPDIDQLRVPVGAAEPVAPVTEAVKVNEPPKVGEPEATTEIAGVIALTTIDEALDTPDTALYVPSESELKTAV